MASGSQNMTTYNARTVTGSSSAASPAGALLLSGAGRADDATGDTWIFLDSAGGTTNPWGIKHDQTNNKLQIFGSGTNSVSVRMNTGDTYILGKVGIGYDPETSGNTYKLYVDGTSYFTNNLTMNGGTITLWGERYNGNYGLNCNNSDIIGVNSIRMADNAKTYGEGLMFKNGSAWDCMAASDGTFYFCSATDGTPALSNANSTANLRCNLVNNWHFDTVSSLNANDVRTTNGMWACAAAITNAAMTNHSVLFGASNVGTPFQLQIPDSSHLYIYKRWYASGAWSGWTKIYAGYADSAGSVAWDNVTGKPSTFPPSSHTHSYLPLSGGTMTGNISFSNSGTDFRGINYGTMGDNDQWRVGGAATGSNAGYMEIATADDGNEPIYVRQYTGVFSSVKRTLTLLDASGNTTFPGKVTATGGYADRTNGTATYLNYGASGLAASAISWLTCWNGYELRAISKTEMANAVDSAHKWVRLGGDTMSGTLALVNNTQDNATYNALLYIQHKSHNDWGAIIDKSSYDWGLNVICGSTAANAVKVSGRITGTNVYGAVWNDYAECRRVILDLEPGRVVYETSEQIMKPSYDRLQAGCRVISDTFGMCIGETEEAKTPIAVTGRVLVYPYRPSSEYPLGAAVCSTPNGTVDIMTREEIMMYPERIIGTVSEIPNYEIWHAGERDGNHEIKVNGRIWIYVR